MSGHALKRCFIAAMCIWLLSCPQPSVAREPPAAGCIDLHRLSGGWRTGEREILIRSSGESAARLELAPACPAFAEGVDLETLAPGGWACPGSPVSVRGGATTCAVIRMSALPAAELDDALQAWAAHLRSAVTLERVEVRRPRWNDRTGTTDQCVDARYLRGWRHEGGDGLVVDVAPQRHSGNRYYRVEMAGTCSDLSSVQSIRLESRIGAAAICGRPGDRVVLIDDEFGKQMGGPRSAATRERNCEITRVVPLQQG